MYRGSAVLETPLARTPSGAGDRPAEEEDRAGPAPLGSAKTSGGAERRIVVANPEAGDGWEPGRMHELVSPLGAVSFVVAQSAEEARRTAERASARGAEMVVAAGGDGTVNCVVNGIVSGGGEPCLGILPLGTGNDSARSMGIPLDPEDAVEALGSGARRRIDLITAGGPPQRYFVNMAVGGLGAPVDEGAEGAKESSLGNLAYVLGVADEMISGQPHWVTLECDDHRVECEALAVIIANGRCSAGSVPVAPHARPDDGLADIVLVPGLDVTELAGLVPRILRGEHVDDEDVLVRRSRYVQIRANPPLPFRVDGEDHAEAPLRFRVIPNALELAVGE